MSDRQKMQSLSNSPRVDIETFLDSGFSVRDHLAQYLQLKEMPRPDGTFIKLRGLIRLKRTRMECG